MTMHKIDIPIIKARYPLKEITAYQKDKIIELLSCRTFYNDPAIGEVDFENFCWKSEKGSRSWWWRLQQLPSLKVAVGTWSKLSHDEISSLISYNQEAIKNWFSNSNSQNTEKHLDENLSWHDHASALRVDNIFEWTHTLIVNGYKNEEEIEFNFSLISSHIQWLLDNENYTKHTNHGYDQSFVILKIATIWKELFLDETRAIAINRIIDEVTVGFSEEGIHIENSPSYHFYMLQRLERLFDFLNKHGISYEYDLKSLIDKARNYFFAILTPDDSLPLIGDSENSLKSSKAIKKYIKSHQKLYESKKNGVFDYSKSGYLIYKCQKIYVVFKASHLSDYHRHDDDLSLYLIYRGREFFIDSGRFTYDNRNIFRKYVRSPQGHSTVFPSGFDKVALFKGGKIATRPKMKLIFDHNYLFEAITYRYKGYLVKRRLLIDRQREQIVIIDDIDETTESSSLNVVEKGERYTNFVLPEGIKVDKKDQDNTDSYTNSLFKLTNKDASILVEPNSPVESCQLIVGKGPDNSNIAVLSREQNRLVNNSRLLFRWKNSQFKIKLTLVD